MNFKLDHYQGYWGRAQHLRSEPRGRISLKISPLPSLTIVLTNEYLYAIVGRFC
jgi:hypothetical protein